MRHGTQETSGIEEFFRRKCIKSNQETKINTSTRQVDDPSSLVMIEESTETNGIGWAVLQHATSLFSKANVSRLIHIQLMHPVHIQHDTIETIQLKYDIANWNSTPLTQNLLERMHADIQTISTEGKSVVVIDCLSTMLQLYPIQTIASFLETLRHLPSIEVVMTRYSKSLHSTQITSALRNMATAYLVIETRASIAAYPLLSKESKREVPMNMDGLILFIRQTNNGKYDEKMETFQIELKETKLILLIFPVDYEKNIQLNPDLINNLKDDISFNLKISKQDQKAKDNVTLPYRHQGKSVFYIDENDPDWDDDDLDDDLDI